MGGVTIRAMWREVRLAFRSIRRAPGVAVACALTLAVGAGAATAVLQLLNGVVLKPLPVERPRELVLFSDDPSSGVYTGTPRGTLFMFSTPSYTFLRTAQRTFADVAAFQTGRERFPARIDGSAELSEIARVSGNYFAVLGVRAQAGRLLTDADDRAGTPFVAVISDAFWQRRFERDPAIVGRGVVLRSMPFTIVGVAARGFYGESLHTAPDFWLPIGPTGTAGPSGYDEHHTWWLGLIGRLKPGTTMTQASVDVNARLQEFLIDEAGSAAPPERRDEIAHTNIALARGDLGRSAIRVRAVTPLMLLAVLVALLLVTAAINVASLLMAGAAARDRVTLIHTMLGAKREQLVRLATVEALTVALPGLAAGIAAALASPRALLPLLTATPLPLDVSPDARLLAMVVVVSAVAALIACAGPVWSVMTIEGRHMGRPLRHFHLFGRWGGAARPHPHRIGSTLIVAQIALAIPLLIVAGLLLRSVERLEGQQLAVDRDHVLLVDFGPSLAGGAPGVVRAELFEKVLALPHVVSATFASQTPLGGNVHGSSVRVEGMPPREDSDAEAAFVGPAYLRTIGTPLVAGRDFTAQDDAAHPRVIIVSETVARVFLGDHPLGQRVAYGTRPFAEVVGVAKDIKLTSLREPPHRQVYLPQLQYGAFVGRLVIKTGGDPLAIAGPVRDAIRTAAPNLPITKLTTIDEEIRAATATERALAMTATALASATLLVCAIGLCGLMAYIVARRTREFGIRMALGASRRRMMGAVVASALRLVAVGAAVGAAGAMATGKVVTSLLYDVNPADWIALTGAAVAMLTAALAASLVPAAQASRVDPIVALRVE